MRKFHIKVTEHVVRLGIKYRKVSSVLCTVFHDHFIRSLFYIINNAANMLEISHVQFTCV